MRSHTGVAPNRVYSNGLFPAIECALTALFHPYLVITSSISFRIPRLTPVTPKRTQQSGSFRKRRRSGMSAPCRVRRGKGYEACDDEAVYLCCTFPEVAFGGRYPLFLPCGARTFLMNRLSPCPRDCPAYSHSLFYSTGTGKVNAHFNEHGGSAAFYPAAPPPPAG